jgi:hypothetical protein
MGYFRVSVRFLCDLRIEPSLALECPLDCCFDRSRPVVSDSRFSVQSLSHTGGSLSAQATQSRRTPKRAAQKVSCEECFFRVNLLCALELSEPCATFRPHEAQLRPPQQLRFVFRQERRSRAAWAFPSAQEQAALHA